MLGARPLHGAASTPNYSWQWHVLRTHQGTSRLQWTSRLSDVIKTVEKCQTSAETRLRGKWNYLRTELMDCYRFLRWQWLCFATGTTCTKNSHRSLLTSLVPQWHCSVTGTTSSQKCHRLLNFLSNKVARLCHWYYLRWNCHRLCIYKHTVVCICIYILSPILLYFSAIYNSTWMSFRSHTLICFHSNCKNQVDISFDLEVIITGMRVFHQWNKTQQS
jgi:hypothetical protein